MTSTENHTESSQKTTEKSVEKSVEKIISAIKENPSITVKELTIKVGLTRRGVEKQVALHKTKGLLRRVGPDKGGRREIVE